MQLNLSHSGFIFAVDYSLVQNFEDFIGEYYEVYGSIDIDSDTTFTLCSSSLINLIQDADIRIIEQTFRTFNMKIYPQMAKYFN